MFGKDYKIMLNMSTLAMSTLHKHLINNSADQHGSYNALVCPQIFIVHFLYFSRWWKTMHNAQRMHCCHAMVGVFIFLHLYLWKLEGIARRFKTTQKIYIYTHDIY